MSAYFRNIVLGPSEPEVQWKKPKLNASSSSYPATMATLLLLSLDSQVALLLMQLVAWSSSSLWTALATALALLEQQQGALCL